jgi:glycosyltransferase involved in cell wall biosynthesis
LPPKISLLLPTRGRKTLLSRLFQSLIDTTTDLSRIEVVLYMDDDDLDSQNATFEKRVPIKKIVGPRATMGLYNSKCLEASDGTIAILINDDIVIRTPGWDRTLIDYDEHHPDTIYLGYINDLFKKSSLGSFPVLSRKTVDILISPYPEPYKGEHIDYHLFDIFKRIKEKGIDRFQYFEDVVFEHMHFSQGKAAIDQTYLDRKKYEDDDVFLSLAPLRKNAAERLIASIRGFPIPGLIAMPAVMRTSSFPAYTWRLYQSVWSDSGLPLSWRSRICLWFSWRYFARNGRFLWLKKWVSAAKRGLMYLQSSR